MFFFFFFCFTFVSYSNLKVDNAVVLILYRWTYIHTYVDKRVRACVRMCLFVCKCRANCCCVRIFERNKDTILLLLFYSPVYRWEKPTALFSLFFVVMRVRLNVLTRCHWKSKAKQRFLIPLSCSEGPVATNEYYRSVQNKLNLESYFASYWVRKYVSKSRQCVFLCK